MPNDRPAWLGALLVIVAASLFGSLGVASRLAYDAGLEPFALVAWRASVGAIGLWLTLLLVRGPAGIRTRFGALDGAGRRWLALAIALGLGVNAAAFLSFDYTTVALALLGFYTYPALVAAGSVLLGREPLDLTKVVALVLSIGGMVAVVLGGGGGEALPATSALGVGLALGAAVFQTIFILTTRGYAALAADQVMGSILAGTAGMAIVLSLATIGPAALALPFSQPGLLLLLVLVGLFAAALPSVLFLTGIRWIGGVRTGILMLFEPVVGVVLAAIVLAESLQPVQIAGGATILAAALLVQRSSRPQPGVESGAVMPAPGGP